MTEEFARPATLDDLKLLVRSLNAQGADYLLIGGYALYAHGYHRGTVDIDILAPMTREAGSKIREALMALPDRAARSVDVAWFEDGDTIRVGDVFVVDIMFKTCGETYETLSKHAETVELDGIPIRTINLEGLLKTKQTLRDKDTPDRHVLERALAACRHNTEAVKEIAGLEASTLATIDAVAQRETDASQSSETVKDQEEEKP